MGKPEKNDKKDEKKDEKKDKKKDEKDKDQKKNKDEKDKTDTKIDKKAAKKAAKEAKKKDKLAKKNKTKENCATVAKAASPTAAPAHVRAGVEAALAPSGSGSAAALWSASGKAPGLEIWRVEKFLLVPWPRDQYGQFHTGDAYVVLNTWKCGAKMAHDIHFFLGAECTQDEAGSAAIYTVHLDDFLGGGPVQHREVQGYESKRFADLFPSGITYLEGGVASGFRHVATREINRLLHVKGKRGAVRMTEVPRSVSSLNEGDAFLLDLGDRLLVWVGKSASVEEKQRAWASANALKTERGGKPAVTDFHMGQSNCAEFYALLSGHEDFDEDDIADAEDDADVMDTKKRILKLSDAGGALAFTPVAEGTINKSMLSTNDAFIVDAGYEIYVWIGNGASPGERKEAMRFAQSYADKENKSQLPITRVFEKSDSPSFDAVFAQSH